MKIIIPGTRKNICKYIIKKNYWGTITIPIVKYKKMNVLRNLKHNTMNCSLNAL